MPVTQVSVRQFETEALIRCLSLKTEAAQTGFKDTLVRVSDWGFLLKTSLDHGVFPSLYLRVAVTCPEAVPPEVLAAWRRLYQVQARRNLRLTGELLQVLALFESQGVTAIPLKGPVLAQAAYGDLALRQFVDLDILVSRKDIGKVRDLLFAEGYRFRDHLTEKQERLHLKLAAEFPFEHSRRTELDIHWRFAADFMGAGLDPGEAMARRVPVQILGKKVYSLHPEDNLLMLSLHGNHHFWSPLSTVSDVAHLIHSQDNWNWPQVLQRAKDSGLRRQTLLGLSLAQELLGAPVPPEIMEEAEADPSVVAVHQWLAQNLWVRRTEEDLGFSRRTSFYLQTRDSFRDQVRHVCRRLIIPTSGDWGWVSLPDFLYGLYFVIRPFRLGFQGLILPAWRRFRK